MSRPENANIAELARLFKDHGANSVEFHGKVKNFLIFVQHRHMGGVDEDLTSRIFLRVLQSLAYYNPKTNIGTWVYTVARNQISSFVYERRKRDRESPDDLEFEEDRSDSFLVSEREDFLDSVLRQFTRIEVEDVHGTLKDDMASASMEEPLVRAILWEQAREGIR